MGNTKIKSLDDLVPEVQYLKDKGRKVGFTNGCFDILHLGHVKYLEEAKRDCDVLIIGVNSDVSVCRLKGPERPVNPENARMEVLSALECTDFIVLFDEDTPEDIIKTLTPDVLFKGGDWDENSIIGADHVKTNGGTVKIVPFVGNFSTTDIIEKLKRGNKS